MKKLYIAAALASLMFAGVSCTEYNIYPEEYANVVAVKNYGEVECSVYSTDAVSTFNVNLLKGGHTEGASTAEVRAMTQEEFDAYLLESGAEYIAMPSDCYSFSADGATTSTTVTVENFKQVPVYINTAKYVEFKNANPGPAAIVIPVVLESNTATVNTDCNQVFIKPTYVVPSVTLGSTGTKIIPIDGNVTIPITLPIENRWDNFTVEVGIDYDYINDLNSKQGTSYTAVDINAIQGLESSYVIPKGEKKVDIKMTINTSALGMADLLPLKIKSCSVDGVNVDTRYYLGVPQVVRRQLTLTAESFTSNAKEPTEGSYAALCDNNTATFFHSAWSVSVSGTHNLQVTLPEAVQDLQIEWSNRVHGTPNTPGDFSLYYGTDASDLTLWKTYTRSMVNVFNAEAGTGISNASGGSNVMAPIHFDKPTKVIRMDITSSMNGNKFFVLSEFRAYTKK